MAEFNTDVSQGSMLGSLLFIAYISDIFNLPCNAKFITYADYTSILLTGTNPDGMIYAENALMYHI